MVGFWQGTSSCLSQGLVSLARADAKTPRWAPPWHGAPRARPSGDRPKRTGPRRTSASRGAARWKWEAGEVWRRAAKSRGLGCLDAAPSTACGPSCRGQRFVPSVSVWPARRNTTRTPTRWTRGPPSSSIPSAAVAGATKLCGICWRTL